MIFMKTLEEFKFDKVPIQNVFGGRNLSQTIIYGVIIGPNGEPVIVEQGFDDSER
jgi:hypothetical protein